MKKTLLTLLTLGLSTSIFSCSENPTGPNKDFNKRQEDDTNNNNNNNNFNRPSQNYDHFIDTKDIIFTQEIANRFEEVRRKYPSVKIDAAKPLEIALIDKKGEILSKVELDGRYERFDPQFGDKICGFIVDNAGSTILNTWVNYIATGDKTEVLITPNDSLMIKLKRNEFNSVKKDSTSQIIKY